MSRNSRFRQFLLGYSSQCFDPLSENISLIHPTASGEVDPLQGLTSRCRDHLQAVCFTIHKIDILAAEEICNIDRMLEKTIGGADSRRAQQVLFPEHQMTDLVAASTNLLDTDPGDLKLPNWSSNDIVEELSKTQSESLQIWRLVAKALDRIQTRLIHVGTRDDGLYLEFCRTRAGKFLDLANDATLLLYAVREELRAIDYRIVFAIRYRLSTVSEFNSIWERLTPAEEQTQQRRDVTRPQHVFNMNFLRLSTQLEQDDAPGLEYNNTLHKVGPSYENQPRSFKTC